MTTEHDVDSVETRALLQRAGFAAGPDLICERVWGGGNNRLYRIEQAGRRAALKIYFHSAADPRDRIGAEVRYLQVANRACPSSAPQLLAVDEPGRRAVLEWIDGLPLGTEEITAEHVVEAATFVHSATAEWRRSELPLPEASEACTSSLAYLERTAARLARFDALVAIDPPSRSARELVERIRRREWPRAEQTLLAYHERASLAVGALVPSADLIASPSDFGFHNALVRKGSLVFLDFEYAGSDDAAKLVCDFFCQPAIPVARAHLPTFVRALEPHDADALLARAEALLPLHVVRWCCILLGEFLPASAERRLHAQGAAGAERRSAQLQKVHALLERFES